MATANGLARRARPQTLLRLSVADQKRLWTLVKQRGLPATEIVSRFLQRAVPERLSAEARRYLALVRKITAFPTGATVQQQAALEAHCLLAEKLVRRANGAPDQLAWNRWIRTADALRRRVGERHALPERAPESRDAAERPRTYEENLAMLEEARKREAQKEAPPAPQKPRGRTSRASSNEPKPQPPAAPLPAASALVPAVPEPRAQMAAERAQAPVFAKDAVEDFPIVDALKTDRDRRARWLNG